MDFTQLLKDTLRPHLPLILHQLAIEGAVGFLKHTGLNVIEEGHLVLEPLKQLALLQCLVGFESLDPVVDGGKSDQLQFLHHVLHRELLLM